MVDYKKGKIYKIVCNNTQRQYIGSTCVGLSQRLVEHRASYNRFINGKIKNKSSAVEILQGGNYSIFLLEEYPCENRDQLVAKEREWIEKTECINLQKRPILLAGDQTAHKLKYDNDEEWRRMVLDKNKEWRQNTDQDKLREYTKLKMRRLRAMKKKAD